MEEGKGHLVRRAIFIMGVLFLLCGLGAMPARAQSSPHSEPGAAREDSKALPVDGVAARIEDDIILESEVHELGAFQILSDGKAKPRDELIRELADQWIVRGEANTAKRHIRDRFVRSPRRPGRARRRTQLGAGRGDNFPCSVGTWPGD